MNAIYIAHGDMSHNKRESILIDHGQHSYKILLNLPKDCGGCRL